ncbi:tRNA pseudouridine(38-40) synthase TruA [Flavobacteriaceae bacterium F89]|uniref:tRNA pseudouridine synthase A n=1 Tax=Cerina litoralis TaxID=2874477 RepID=A0AAE3ET45_9FLAO|nr:tRNA pseudouridine(38-40) synthase TruA [Cerina litoralis]MCG2459709.1 tRNA pseudouridine(38-40) synthase TruA [Cerina litoralis]
MRYFIDFSYFGASYHGWQRQPNANTVQQVLEGALSTLLQDNTTLVGAGRTDTGVHAMQMIAHFDCVGLENIEHLIYRLNAFLPNDIAVNKIFRVRDDAHARFDAVQRTYMYWIVRKKNPFYRDRAHYVKHPLDVELMKQGASILLEQTDFECFSKSNTDVKTYRCTIKSAKWECDGEKLIFEITADRFLRNMVRAITGTLLDLGLGKSNLDNLEAIIKSKDRSRAGASVPAKGLYLTKVLYPRNIYVTKG